MKSGKPFDATTLSTGLQLKSVSDAWIAREEATPQELSAVNLPRQVARDPI